MSFLNSFLKRLMYIQSLNDFRRLLKLDNHLLVFLTLLRTKKTNNKSNNISLHAKKQTHGYRWYFALISLAERLFKDISSVLNFSIICF